MSDARNQRRLARKLATADNVLVVRDWSPVTLDDGRNGRMRVVALPAAGSPGEYSHMRVDIEPEPAA